MKDSQARENRAMAEASNLLGCKEYTQQDLFNLYLIVTGSILFANSYYHSFPGNELRRSTRRVARILREILNLYYKGGFNHHDRYQLTRAVVNWAGIPRVNLGGGQIKGKGVHNNTDLDQLSRLFESQQPQNRPSCGPNF